MADGDAMDCELSNEETRHLQDQMVQEAVQQLVVLRAEVAGIEAMLQLMKGVPLLPFRYFTSLAVTPECVAHTCWQIHRVHEQNDLQKSSAAEESCGSW